MSRKFLILPLIAAVLATSAMLAPATAQKTTPKTDAVTTNSSKSNGDFKVTAVDAKAKTFTGISKGKAFTFIAPKGKPLPTVGKIYDIAYIENPGASALEAVTVQSSKSNQDN